jgi:hypothetical protein
MTVGLPGTGIGGLFYLLLVLVMPLREMLRILCGRGDVRRWRTIGGTLALAAGILTALWLEAWVLVEILRQNSLGTTAGASAERIARAASFATLASLGVVLVALAFLRLLVRRPLPSARRCVAATRAPRTAESEDELYATPAHHG